MFTLPDIANLDSTTHPPGFVFQRPEGFPRILVGLHLSGMKERTVLSRPPVAYELRANTIVVTEPNVGYTFHVLEETEEMWCFLEPTEWPRFWANWENRAPGDYLVNFSKSVHRGEIQQALRTALVEWRRGPEHHALATNALQRAFLLCERVVEDGQSAPPDPRVAAAASYLQANLAQAISVADLAAEVHMSPSHLAHLFSQQIGVSPIRYLEQCRVQEASKLLLTTNEQIQEIATAVGYTNPFHFSQRFRAATGRSPRHFRKSGGA